MKKITFKYWLTNILISVMLFIAYRVVIAENNIENDGFLESIVQILDAFLNVAYSFIYLLAIAFCSLTIFLNQIDRIRNNNYLSLLTFVGLPFCCVIFIAVVWLIDGLHIINSANNLLLFSTIYLVFCAIQFSFFRKRIQKLNVG